MRYILLDFDGVLTSDAFTRQCVLEHRPENLFGLDWFDPSCLNVLEEIINKTGAAIVISSSWRELGEERLKRLWKELPMPGVFAGTTPEWILTKKEAIHEFLAKHPRASYVILDDDDLGLPNQVRVHHGIGLRKEDGEKAISLLNNNELKD